jgi:type IV pilus assembly protein PilY1
VPDLQPEWDEDGDGAPDNYYVANDGYLLEEQLLAAINSILRKVSSGTSVAVLATSATGEGSLFQAYFEPSVIEGTRTLRWLGHLQGLWVDAMGNLREDTNNDAALVYAQDKIIKYFLDTDTNETKIEKYSDSDSDGVADSTTPDAIVSLSDATPIWEAGKALAKRTAASRTIYTFKDSNNNGLPETGEFIPFTTSNATALQPYLRASDSTEAQNIISFIRGVQVSGYRDRQLTVDGVANQVWKLGDIVYSTPTVSGKPAGNYHITYGDSSDGASYAAYYTQYKDRDVIICTGANDGMLHAFWAGRYHSGDNTATVAPQVEAGWYEDTRTDLDFGDEIWAYIPCNLLPHLKWLTDSNYGNNNHVYYVDLKPRIADVKIFTADSTHINGWGTVLIGGMRLGGGPLTINNFGGGTTSRTFRSAYFALDITDPANPVLLWEYTDANLGYTASYPAVAKVGSKWFAVFGSGPTNLARGDCDNASGTATGAGVNGKIFIVDIATGTASRIFTTAENRAFLTDPIAVDTDLSDFSIDRIYIGETYDAGTTYGGKMYRLWAKNSSGAVAEDPTTWVSPSVLFDTTATGMSKPLTSSAAAAFDEQYNLWVYFGTGKFMGTTDKPDSYQQTFYGIKDPCATASCSTTVANNDTSLFNATNVVVNETGGVATVTNGGSSVSWSNLLGQANAKTGGWYYNLWTSSGLPSERVIYRPVVYGGVVLFTTFVPNSDICGYGGSSYLYALNYITGTANDSAVIGKTGTEIIKKQSLGSGMASGVALHVVAAEAGGGSNDIEKAYIQMSTGVIVQANVTTTMQKSGTTGWRETK